MAFQIGDKVTPIDEGHFATGLVGTIVEPTQNVGYIEVEYDEDLGEYSEAMRAFGMGDRSRRVLYVDYELDLVEDDA